MRNNIAAKFTEHSKNVVILISRNVFFVDYHERIINVENNISKRSAKFHGQVCGVSSNVNFITRSKQI